MSFEWEDPTTSEDFFAMVDGEGSTTEDETPAGDEDQTPEKKKEPVEEDEEDEEDDLFSKVESTTEDDDPEEDEETEKGSEKKTKTPKAEGVSTVNTLNFLKEKGLVSFELEDEEELTEELAEELLEDSYDAAVEERIVAKLDALPEDVKNLIQFTLKGGSLNAYLDQVVDNTVEFDEDLDLTDVKNQEAIMREVLALEGEDDEDEIEEKIEYLKDKGTLEAAAQKKFQKYLNHKKQVEQEALAKQAQAREQAKKIERENKKSLSNFLSSNKELSGLPVSRKDKTELPNYIYGRTVELENGNRITEMQKELFYELPKNTAAMSQLAILLRTRNADGTFNFDAIAKKSETTVIREIKDKVRRTNMVKGKSAVEVTKAQKPLSEYFK